MLGAVVIGANQFAGTQVGITTLQSDIRELRELQHRAGSDLAERENPSRIESYAQQQGMVVARDASYVAVDGADVAGLSQSER